MLAIGDTQYLVLFLLDRIGLPMKLSDLSYLVYFLKRESFKNFKTCTQSVYRVLKSFIKNNLVEVEDPTKKRYRKYKITPLGRGCYHYSKIEIHLVQSSDTPSGTVTKLYLEGNYPNPKEGVRLPHVV